MHNFNRSDLADQGSQGRHVVVIFELANEDLQSVDVEEGDSELTAMLFDRQDIL